jgi:hypothetical protein
MPSGASIVLNVQRKMPGQLRVQIVHFSIDRFETVVEPLLDRLTSSIELLIERVDLVIEPPNLAEQMIPMSGYFFHSSLEHIDPRLLRHGVPLRLSSQYTVVSQAAVCAASRLGLRIGDWSDITETDMWIVDCQTACLRIA